MTALAAVVAVSTVAGDPWWFTTPGQTRARVKVHILTRTSTTSTTASLPTPTRAGRTSRRRSSCLLTAGTPGHMQLKRRKRCETSSRRYAQPDWSPSGRRPKMQLYDIACVFNMIFTCKIESSLCADAELFLHQVSILDTGEVCMELLKSQSGQERVKEVLRISCDGSLVSRLTLTLITWHWAVPLYESRCGPLQVTIYQPNDGKGFPVLDCPPAPPEDILICSFDDLPGAFQIPFSIET